MSNYAHHKSEHTLGRGLLVPLNLTNASYLLKQH